MVVDASVWISATLPGDVNHELSSRWIDQMNAWGEVLIVPAHFPAEVCGAISRIQPHGISLDLMTDVLFDAEFFDVRDIAAELSRVSAEVARVAALRGSDAIYVALASMIDEPLVTWDNEQRERGAPFCRTMTPTEAIATELESIPGELP